MPSQILTLLEPHFASAQKHINADPDFQASAAGVRCAFAITSSENPNDSVIVGIDSQRAALEVGPAHYGTFAIQARPEDWTAFFDGTLVRPYQSFWGMLRVLAPENKEIAILGDQQSFAAHARIWRIVLDRIRDAVHGKAIRTAAEHEPPAEEVVEDDAVTGKYIWLEMAEYGKVKIFYETAGDGPQDILFLHTAGSDSRQYHTLMNNADLRERCTMYAFDLPAHGRSSLGSKQAPEGYKLTEASYLEAIGKVIARLRLRNTILCGASMAGHVCLAAAIAAKKLDVHGVIACEACEHLAFDQPIYEIKGADTSLLDPERVCGMCAPTSPEYYKRQVWWQYSSNGYGVFAGDLKFYFRGWDGRGRVEGIDTRRCPVYLLTGEYDYSCTTEASKATADKIPGARFEAMKGLGHFPLTENPELVLPYLLRAIAFIQRNREDD
ncbi:alpha/beta hydrolase fold family protein [Neohortaea acidophila]|uniref:Alpha/beta hydrolase fold family protein n=1 Tax=Neohortaea acidophila TaxID=245834 RepID=A0A6A6Q3B0_9PEZI|nr:alpha/beta hydrolase fold family protein [Neohortaea acidophila]KAF2486494.1 alpha/beta hydrolase fold family protein [Neohortaea acidophila]